uniref:Uncharacterized protein n=1 Tax=Rhizophora mucronata TaxID=61149 RepID=A0A2P2QPU3_RHIMU
MIRLTLVLAIVIKHSPLVHLDQKFSNLDPTGRIDLLVRFTIDLIKIWPNPVVFE